MSLWERDVLKVLSRVQSGDCSQVEAARLLRRSTRQVRRLLRRIEAEGDVGVIHKSRGRPSNNATPSSVKQKALALVREKYAGFGPTLAWEQLRARHRIDVGVETLRTWMLKEGLWKRARKSDLHRSRRPRRDCFGEMVLADASEHRWLEDRGPVLTLVGIIDDATDRIELKFFEAETTAAYMEVLESWLMTLGRPRSWYSDRHGIFRGESRIDSEHPVSVPTQFSRALSQLDIELILANSPQAKGRIERLWGTAQDRLVKLLRGSGATTLKEANRVLKRFVKWFNDTCTHEPRSKTDAHRPIEGLDVESILSSQEVRSVMNDYTISFEGVSYQLLPPVWPGERGGKVTIERREGAMKIRFRDRYLKFERVGVSNLGPRRRLPSPVLASVSGPASEFIACADPC